MDRSIGGGVKGQAGSNEVRDIVVSHYKFCVSLSSKCIIRPTQGRAEVVVVAEEELRGLAV